MDPIDRDDFNPHRKRPANEGRLAEIRRVANLWHQQEQQADYTRDDLAVLIREAKMAGHSYQQLAEAAGVSIGVIQRIVKE